MATSRGSTKRKPAAKAQAPEGELVHPGDGSSPAADATVAPEASAVVKRAARKRTAKKKAAPKRAGAAPKRAGAAPKRAGEAPERAATAPASRARRDAVASDGGDGDGARAHAKASSRDAQTLAKIARNKGKNLVIVESPAKAKTLEKFLGRDFYVLASYGHVKDLPKSGLGIDIDRDFEPEYVAIEGKAKVLSHLKHAAALAGDVYLAPDPDREGEAIAWHLATALKRKDRKLQRLEFNEITERAVKAALAQPRGLDMNLVNAQQARRVLDRLVGYQVSPLLWQVVRYGLSAGRVQSVALRLICERESEILAFIPEEYWTVEAELETEAGERFHATLFRVGERKLEDRELVSEVDCQRAIQEMRANAPVVADLKETERRANPKPPFITSTLQQEAYGRLGFGSKRTMQVAQRLYEGVALGSEGHVGLITYMRTDSTRLAAEAVEELRAFVVETYGDEYLPEKAPVYGKRAQAQDAHEAIRPTSVARQPDQLSRRLTEEQVKLYRLIWSRAVASQMSPARFKGTTVDVAMGSYGLKATGSVLLFPGYLRAYGETDEERSSRLPALTVGQRLRLVDLQAEQHFTQPPPRYTEATLVKALEELGIGRPSTYATIITTITSRDYVNRDGGRLMPTELGMAVSKLLTATFPDIFQVDFTRRMEEELDRVETGEDEWHTVVREFYTPFRVDLDRAQAAKKMLRSSLEEKTDIACEQCGTLLVRRFGRNGPFYACPRYPECKYTRPIEASEIPQLLDEICPSCGQGQLQARSGRYGRFIACSRYPDCKYTRPVGLGVPCPLDGCTGELVQRRSKRGKTFFSCNRYPDCTYATWDRPVADRPCPSCAFPFLSEKLGKRKGAYLKCSKCGYEEVAEAASA